MQERSRAGEGPFAALPATPRNAPRHPTWMAPGEGGGAEGSCWLVGNAATRAGTCIVQEGERARREVSRMWDARCRGV